MKNYHIKMQSNTKTGDPLRLSDNPKYPPQKNLAKTPRTPHPLDFQVMYLYDVKNEGR